LGESVERGFSDLQASGTHITSVFKEYYGSGTAGMIEELSDFKILSKFIDRWIIGDALDRFKSKFRDPPVSITRTPFSLYRRHPLLCGLLQFQLHLIVQKFGIALSGNWRSLLSVAHLYEACRPAGYLKQIWPDMELFMDIHTREKIFHGRVPQTPAESLKCMKLTVGVSTVNFSPTARLNNMKLTKGMILSSNSSVANVFGRHWIATRHAMFTIDTVEDLLKGPNYASTSTITTTQEKDSSPLHRQWAKTHKLTPLQLLDSLHRAIAAEEHMLRFDYITLHLRCLRLLRTLKTVFDDRLRRFFGRNYIQKESQLYLLPLSILMMAAKSEEIRESRGLKTGFENPILKRTSEVISELIELEGSIECDRLEETCIRSGFPKGNSDSDRSKAEESLPEESLPEESLPEESLQEELLPEELLPEESLQEESLQEEGYACLSWF
jgi:hypothetical protein